MPSSQHEQISKILDFIITLDPQSVLDIGVGFGKYGFLCREYLELWDGRENYKTFLRRIDGIEVYSQYITPVHDFIYDNIYIGNASDILDRQDLNYDLVLLIDVLEHFTKDQGRELIGKILKISKGVLIAIPKDIGAQKDSFQNAYETHRAGWTKRELSEYPHHYFQHDAASYIVYIGTEQEIIKIRDKYPPLVKLKMFLMTVPVLASLLHFIKRALLRK